MNNAPLSASQTSMPQRRAAGTSPSGSDTRESILADFGQLLQRWQAVTQDQRSGLDASSSTTGATAPAGETRGTRMGDEPARREPAGGARRSQTAEGMPGTDRAASRDSESARAARRADDERDIESRRTRQRLGGSGAHGARHEAKPQEAGRVRGASDDVAEATPTDETREASGPRGRHGHCHGAHRHAGRGPDAATDTGSTSNEATASDATDAAGNPAQATDRSLRGEQAQAVTDPATTTTTAAAATAAAAAAATAQSAATATDTTAAGATLNGSIPGAEGAASATARAAAHGATGAAGATGSDTGTVLADASGTTTDGDTTASSLFGEPDPAASVVTPRPGSSSTAARPAGAATAAGNAASISNASTSGRASIDAAAIDSVVDSLREALEALESLGRRASGPGTESTTSLVAGARHDVAAAFSSLLRATDASLQAPAASPTPMQATLSTPMQDPAWGATLSRQVADFAQAGIQAAEITVNPPELGPMKVELSMSGESLSVAFSAAQPETRQAIEQTLGTLRTMLAEQGMILKDASVDAGPRDNPSRDANAGANGQRTTRDASTGGGDRQTAGTGTTTVQRRGPGLLDLYA